MEALQATRPAVNMTAAEAGSLASWEESYRPLPLIFLVLVGIWVTLLSAWCVNTWNKRRFQLSNLQWALTSVPLLKSLVLSMSLVFWYSCLSLDTCSFWVAFGVFVSRIFFETACFVAFLLLAHGYCITQEQLTLTERRKIAVLAGLLYLTLTGYKAALPHFSVLVLVVYLMLLYVIFHQCSVNISHLDVQQQGILEDGLQGMYCAVHSKYIMFKRFRAAMAVTLVVEVLMHAGGDGMADEYWIRLLVREALELAIFGFIGWTFRSRQQSPFFAVMPSVQEDEGPRKLPPIHSVEMDEHEFRRADFRDWHIGVPAGLSTGVPNGHTMIVIVQNPCELMMAAEPVGSCHVSSPFMAPQMSQPLPSLDCHGVPRPSGIRKAIRDRMRLLKAAFRYEGTSTSGFERRDSPIGSTFEKGEPRSGTAITRSHESCVFPDCSRCGGRYQCSPNLSQGVVGSNKGAIENGKSVVYSGVDCSEKPRHGGAFHENGTR